jgi:hypothetical protein
MYMVNHRSFFSYHLLNVLNVKIKIEIIPYAHFIINLFKVYKDQDEHCAIPTSNVLGFTSLKDF